MSRVITWVKRFIVRSYLIFLILYILGLSIPLEWFWFQPGEPSFSNSTEGTSPKLSFSRTILVPVDIKYALVIRDARSDDVICDAIGGPFTYTVQEGPVINKTLADWGPSDSRCKDLTAGLYWGEVSWTAIHPLQSYLPDPLKVPLGWLIPEKTVSKHIPLFKINKKVPE